MAELSPVRHRSKEAGEIRIRNLVELVVVFFLVYAIFQIAPAVVTRVNFLTELDVIANSTVQETALELRQKVLRTAEAAASRSTRNAFTYGAIEQPRERPST